MAHCARHDRLDHREDVLDAMVEFVDYRCQATLEPDPHLDLTAEPQIVISYIPEQPAHHAGQREADGRYDQCGLPGALQSVGLGVVVERPVATSERHHSRHWRGRLFLRYRSRGDAALIVGNELL